MHRINARAEVKVTKELIKKFQRVTGKENLLFRLAEATVDAGDRLVQDTVLPAAPQPVLRDLVAEFKSSGPTYQRTVKATAAGEWCAWLEISDRAIGTIKLTPLDAARSRVTSADSSRRGGAPCR